MSRSSRRRDTRETRDTTSAITTLRRVDWRRIETQLLDAFDRAARTPRSAVDGYPVSTIGGGGGKGNVSRPTEVAAFSEGADDPIHDLVLRAAGCVAECAGAAAELDNTLAKIARLSNAPVTSKTCELCGEEGDLVWGTVNGVLTEAHDLCRRRCYHFVRDNKAWPTEDQRAYFVAKGRWRVRVA